MGAGDRLDEAAPCLFDAGQVTLVTLPGHKNARHQATEDYFVSWSWPFCWP